MAHTATCTYLSDLDASVKVSRAAFLLSCASNEMTALLDDMVDLNRTMLGLGMNIVVVDVDLAVVFKEELELLRGAHPGRQLELEVVGDARGRWDGRRLRRVLRNLVSNAIRYGMPDARVETIVVSNGTDVRIKVTNIGSTIEQ